MRTDSEMNRRRLEAIIDVKHSETERFEQGYLVRGVQIEVTLDSHGFAGAATSVCSARC
jgi:type VI secretion system protein ImpG